MENTKNIYFIRHGESEGNVAEIIQSEKGHLTSKGKEQARKIAQRFNGISVDRVVSSSIERARETADIISQELDISLECSDLFAELRYPSSLFGKGYKTDALPVLQVLYKKFHDPKYQHSDEETFAAFKDRGLRALEFLKNKEEKNLLVVSHASFIKLLLALMLFGDEMTSYDLEKVRTTFLTRNAGVTHCEHRPSELSRPNKGWRLSTYNDHSHI